MSNKPARKERIPLKDSDKTVGQRLLWSRLAIDKTATQQSFCDDAGIHRTSYVEWELGTRTVTLDGLVKLHNAYGLATDWILFGRLGTVEDPDLKKAIVLTRLSYLRKV